MKTGFKITIVGFLLVCAFTLKAQKGTLAVKILLEDSTPDNEARVLVKGIGTMGKVADSSHYTLANIPYGRYAIAVFSLGYQLYKDSILIEAPYTSLTIVLKDLLNETDAVEMQYEVENTFGITYLKGIEGTAIYEAKKTEVVVMKDVTANLSTNNPRQVYSKVTGLNIWESDAAGLQLGIGGRGLSPNRTSNFNTRQNGYDISADALGYPESYYTPPAEALEKIEIVRGAASLQYGTQFGGLLNFVMKKGPANKKIEVTTRQTLGNYGYFGSFTSVGGTVGKVNYYALYQHKQGDGWRANSAFYSNTAYVRVAWKMTEKTTQTIEATYMGYLAKQPGGLTDAQFEENPLQSVRNRNWFTIQWNLFSWQVDYKVSQNTLFNWRTFGLVASRKSLGNLERINVADFGKNRTLIEGAFTNIGHEGRWLQQYKLGKQRHALVAGYRLYFGQTTNKQGYGNDASGPDFHYLNPQNLENSDYTFPNYNASVFAENIFNLSERTSITPGIRFEYIHTKAKGYYKQRVLDAAGNVIVDNRIEDARERLRRFCIAGIGIKHILTKRAEVYANFSQNYRAINFSDLRVANPNFIVDTAIQDEKGFTADLGIRGTRAGLFTYEFTLFYIYYKGRIGQILKADQPPLYIDYRYRTNIADAQNRGVEMMGEVNIWKLCRLPHTKNNQLAVFVNTAFVDAKYIHSEDKSINGNRVEMVPAVMFRSGLNYRYTKLFRFSAQYSYTSQQYSDATNATLTSTAVEGLIKSYSVIDLSATVLYKNVSLDMSCNNLLNSYYFTRRAESYPGPGIIPADGRVFYATVGIIIGK